MLIRIVDCIAFAFGFDFVALGHTLIYCINYLLVLCCDLVVINIYIYIYKQELTKQQIVSEGDNNNYYYYNDFRSDKTNVLCF